MTSEKSGLDSPKQADGFTAFSFWGRSDQSYVRTRPTLCVGEQGLPCMWEWWGYQQGLSF